MCARVYVYVCVCDKCCHICDIRCQIYSVTYRISLLVCKICLLHVHVAKHFEGQNRAPIPNIVNVKDFLTFASDLLITFFFKGNSCQLLQSPASVALAGGKQTDRCSKVSQTDAAPRAGPKRGVTLRPRKTSSVRGLSFVILHLQL